MRYAVSVYGSYFVQFLKARLAYRADFFASLASNIVATLAGMFFILFLMDGDIVHNLAGWRREEVLFIYGYSMLALSGFHFVAVNLYSFADRYIIQGGFDRILLRPLSTMSQVLFETFNLEAAGTLIVGLGVISYAGEKLQMDFTAADWVWLLVSSASGTVILVSVFVLVSSLSFHFEDRLGISAPVYNLIQFSRYPLPIFNSVVRFVLQWIVPFAFVAFYPATHFFDRREFLFFCYLTPAMAVLTFAAACLAWRLGVNRYCSTGN